jgi:hypothetical protein
MTCRLALLWLQTLHHTALRPCQTLSGHCPRPAGMLQVFGAAAGSCWRLLVGGGRPGKHLDL